MKFLTPAEAQAVSAHFSRRRDVIPTLDGGFEAAERTRAIFIGATMVAAKHTARRLDHY